MAIATKKIMAKAGLDKTISYTILFRIAQSAGGILILFLVTRLLAENEQGYFYTFLSIISIRTFFELGFTTVLTQFIAHEYAHLSWKNKEQLAGDEYHLSRLSSIIRLSAKRFIFTCLILFLVLLITGWIFFSEFNSPIKVDWQLPWFLLALSTSVMLLIDLMFAIFEGLGKIEQITKLRLIHQLIYILFTAIFLLTNLKLLANGVALLFSAIVAIVLLFCSGYIKIIKNLWVAERTLKVNYTKEILPFQSRIAIGNFSNFFIFHLFNPVLFATQGSVVAGQMGATQTFLAGIATVATSWFSTKVPLFSQLVAKRKFKLLNLSFRENLARSIIVCVSGLLMFNIALLIIKTYLPHYGNRFLGFEPIIFLSLTHLANVIGIAQGYYLRSFKRDPFFVSAIVIGLLTGISTIICSKYFDVTGITIGCFLINGVIGLSWGSLIFMKKKAAWSTGG
jgi:O-antigen/teichoic acid export membrane protein